MIIVGVIGLLLVLVGICGLLERVANELGRIAHAQERQLQLQHERCPDYPPVPR